MRINGNILISINININIVIIGNPVLITVPSGDKAIALDGVDQALNFGDQTIRCLGDVEKCSLGLTISFNIKIKEKKDNCFIMSSGGEEGDSYGIAMWIYRGKLYSRVSTKKYEWTVYTKDFEVDEYFGCKMSWSKQYGLSFYKNKKHKKTSRKHKKRKGSKSRRDKFYIGRSMKGGVHHCKMEIDGFTTVDASEEVVEEINVPYGKSNIKIKPHN